MSKSTSPIKAHSINELEALGDEMIGKGIKNQWSSIRNGYSYHQKGKGIFVPTIEKRDLIGRRPEEEIQELKGNDQM